jgi:hypothetical protein
LRDQVASVEHELRRYKTLAENAMAQVDEAALNRVSAGFNNSIAILVWHISGNLKSRFLDFLNSDGEKPWRARDEEFVARQVSRAELLEKWDEGWRVALDAVGGLSDPDLDRTVTIRQEPLRVHQALHRALAHVAYHVGQIVYVAKASSGDAWKFLSIPPGMSEEYNKKLARVVSGDDKR